jgi:hypothetical protein
MQPWRIAHRGRPRAPARLPYPVPDRAAGTLPVRWSRDILRKNHLCNDRGGEELRQCAPLRARQRPGLLEASQLASSQPNAAASNAALAFDSRPAWMEQVHVLENAHERAVIVLPWLCPSPGAHQRAGPLLNRSTALASEKVVRTVRIAASQAPPKMQWSQSNSGSCRTQCSMTTTSPIGSWRSTNGKPEASSGRARPSIRGQVGGLARSR